MEALKQALLGGGLRLPRIEALDLRPVPMDITQTAWRRLAEPTYGIRSIGDAVRLPAGSLIQVITPVPELGDTVEAVVCPPGREGYWDEYSDVLVTASALRFHGHRSVGANEQEA